MDYQYGDIVYGVCPYSGSVFALEDFCLGMVVRTKDGVATRVLILNSRYIDNSHPKLNNVKFQEAVREIRRYPDLFETSRLKREYNMFIVERHVSDQDEFAYVRATEEGFAQMNHHVKRLLEARGLEPHPAFIHYTAFRKRFLLHEFLPVKTKPTLYL